MADAYVSSLGTVGYSRTQAQYLYLSLALVTLAERIADPARVACAYTALASILSVLPFDRLTDDYLHRARELLDESPEPLAGRAWPTWRNRRRRSGRGLGSARRTPGKKPANSWRASRLTTILGQPEVPILKALPGMRNRRVHGLRPCLSWTRAGLAPGRPASALAQLSQLLHIDAMIGNVSSQLRAMNGQAASRF